MDLLVNPLDELFLNLACTGVKIANVLLTKENAFEANTILISHSNSSDIKLLGQTIGVTIMDSGCSRSECGLTWYNRYLDTLPEKDKRNLSIKDNKATFRFGNGQNLKFQFKVKLPCILEG